MVESEVMEAGAPVGGGDEIDRADGDWRVSGTRKRGRVEFSGKFPFSCHFSALEGFEMDESSQEMAIHDAQRERIFFDFRWPRQEPPPKAMKELLDKLQRVTQAAVIGR